MKKIILNMAIMFKAFLLSALLLTSLGISADVLTYYHNDNLGSPVAATDSAGVVLWKEEYNPYGSRLKKLDNGTNSRWYTGKQEDVDTGLSYFDARWYDPVVGRFMAIDPVGFQQGNVQSFNRYAYANNNPYKYIDLDGNNPKLIADFLLNVSINMLSTGKPGFASAAKDTFLGALNPFKTFKNFQKLTKLLTRNKNVAKGPLARGRAAEQRVLNDLGLSKNTQKVRAGEGASIPDALTKRQSIEIKDCIGVSCTKQIRIQTEAARNSGRQSTLITGDKTRVSGPAQRAFDNIIRRPDLGPQ